MTVVASTVDWPRPTEGQLTVYALGPGFGESQVVFLPDRRCLVVDACVSGGVNLPEFVLERCGVTRIDLLVVSHPDLDHIQGVATLLRRFDPHMTWRYPFANNLRACLRLALRGNPADRRLAAFHDMVEAMLPLEDVNRLSDVASGYEVWPANGDAVGYSVRPLAPTPRDQRVAREQLESLIRYGNQGFEIAPEVLDYLERRSKKPGDHPNTVSIALAIDWHAAGRRVLLGGDVEVGDGSAASGWPGVLDLLRRSGRIDRVLGVDVVKVAHHGSDNAFCDDAWKLHVEGRERTIALVCPFNRSGVLPTDTTLTRLREYAHPLGITAMDVAGLDARVQSAGWSARSTGRMTDADAVLAVVMPATGPAQMLSGTLSAFHELSAAPPAHAGTS